MRNSFLFMVAVAWSGPAFGSSPVDSLMVRAERAYTDGRYAEALALYDSVAITHTSAALDYDLGHCHFRLGHIGRAVLHYERALMQAPADEAIQADLELARQRVVDRIAELPPSPIAQLWMRLRGGRDPDQWARRSLALGLAFFVVLSIAMLLRHRTLRMTSFGIAAALLPLVLFAIVLAGLRHREMTRRDRAIIQAGRVDVHSEPRNEATKLFILHEGTRVLVRKELNGWYEISLANGNIGWLPENALERI